MLTPQPQAKQLARALGLKTELYLKREDLHPHGSHKGRSIPFMIEYYASEGRDNFCISSSGNAAISAAITINEHNAKHKKSQLDLKIFVGKNIDARKLVVIKKLVNKYVLLEKVDNPKQSAFQMDKQRKAKNLRQSTDDTALAGYEALANELAEIKNLAAVFIPTSSGTTAQGLYEGFKKHEINPQIHIVQTPACHPMVESSDPISPSVANAIVDKIGYRQETVQKLVRDSKGNGWIATNDDITEAMRQIKETENIDISPNSALSIEGLKLALKNNWKFDGPVVCILTGR
ncbi:MAG: PLP-dependent lyase/thiolase [Patescibacteria group bacterium]